jgi:serine acetyltransferase
MVGMNAAVTKHVPPMMTVAGTPAKLVGRNKRSKGMPTDWYRSWEERCTVRPEREKLDMTEGDWHYHMGMQ